jgi:hypothetical protein
MKKNEKNSFINVPFESVNRYAWNIKLLKSSLCPSIELSVPRKGVGGGGGAEYKT